MLHRCVATVVLALLSFNSEAQVAVSVGVEYMKWEEDTNPTVTDSGPLIALGLEYTTNRPAGFLFGYRGRFYSGKVDYDGASLFFGTPVRGATVYIGIDNELQARLRRPFESGYWSDLVLGVGWDNWVRKLSSIQREDYDIVYLRLGAEFDTQASKKWLFGAGVKYPLWTRENAHLTEIGFDANPIIEPGRDISFYGNIGYHFDRHWTLIAYADGHRFKRSQQEQVNDLVVTMGPVVVFQPASTIIFGGLKLEYTFR